MTHTIEPRTPSETTVLRRIARRIRNGEDPELRKQLWWVALNLQEGLERAFGGRVHEVAEEVGQSLGALKLMVSRLAGGAGVESAPTLGAMAALIDDALGSVRGLHDEVPPRVLEDLGLTAALEWDARRAAKRASWRLRFHGHGDEVTLERGFAGRVFRFARLLFVFLQVRYRIHLLVMVAEVTPRGVLLQLEAHGPLVSTHEDGPNVLDLAEQAAALDGTFDLTSKGGDVTMLNVFLPHQR